MTQLREDEIPFNEKGLPVGGSSFGIFGEASSGRDFYREVRSFGLRV